MMIDVLASEQLKIRTLRSTWYILGIVIALVGLCGVAGWNMASQWDSLGPQQRAVFGFTPLVSLASGVASLCLAVLGVLAITSEYATGEIHTSFTVVPRRRTILAAKAVVVVVIATISGSVVSLGAFFASRLVEAQASISAELPLLLAAGLSVTMFSMIGLGFGALLKSATGAIAVPVALLYLLPTVAQSLQSPWNEVIGSLAPSALAGQLAGGENTDPSSWLSPLAALGLMVAYAAAPLGLAAVRITREDA